MNILIAQLCINLDDNSLIISNESKYASLYASLVINLSMKMLGSFAIVSNECLTYFNNQNIIYLPLTMQKHKEYERIELKMRIWLCYEKLDY